MQTIHHWSDDVILEDMTLPGLAELKGRWQGSLDASGGGNGDTLVCFGDFYLANFFLFKKKSLLMYSVKREPWAFAVALQIELYAVEVTEIDW